MPVFTIKGRDVLIDEIDVDLLNSHSWWWSQQGYLCTSIKREGRPKRGTVAFHRLALGDPDCPAIDHINRNKSDNRRFNLRCCDDRQNSMNRGLLNKSGKGVTFHKTKKKWQVVVRHNDKVKWLGYFKTQEEALVVSERFFNEMDHNPFRD